MKVHSAVELNDMIFVTCNSGSRSNFWCYEPNKNKWTERAPNPSGRTLLTVKQNICSTFDYFDSIIVGIYDCALNSWKTVFIFMKFSFEWFFVWILKALKFQVKPYVDVPDMYIRFACLRNTIDFKNKTIGTVCSRLRKSSDLVTVEPQADHCTIKSICKIDFGANACCFFSI